MRLLWVTMTSNMCSVEGIELSEIVVGFLPQGFQTTIVVGFLPSSLTTQVHFYGMHLRSAMNLDILLQLH